VVSDVKVAGGEETVQLVRGAAKAFCNERCQAALCHANQIHAGIAQIKEFDLNLWFRRAAAWTMKLGTVFEHRQRIARNLLEGLA